MNIEEFIKYGVAVPNPNYKKPSKSNPAGSPRYIISNNPDDALGVADRISSHVAKYSEDMSHYADTIDDLEEYGVKVNPINTEEELNKERAANQSWLEQTGRALGQGIVNEALIGTVLGISDLIDAGINLFTEEGENDYSNPVSRFLEETQNNLRDRWAIYQENPENSWEIGDFGWYANNAVSAFSTLSLLLPSTGVVKGVSMVGKIGNIGSKAANIAAKTTKAITRTSYSTKRLANSIKSGTEIGIGALASRTMEDYREARAVFDDRKQYVAKELESMSLDERQKMIERNPQLKGKTDEEIVNYIAGVSADKVFEMDYALLLMDIAQFKAIGSLWKGVSKKTPTTKLRTENKKAIKSLVGETIENTEKNIIKSPWLNDRLISIKEAFKHPLTTTGTIQWTEGIEEGYQGIITEKGKEVAEMILNPEFTPRTIGDYLTDGEILEQAAWGVLAGHLYQLGGKALGNVYRKGEAYYKHKKGKLSDEDFALNMTAEEKIRSEEIKERAAFTRKFIEDMKLLNALQSPDEYKTDPITGEIIKEDGVEINKSITEEEAEIKKAKLVNDYITKMTIRAINTGNYDLLKDYISSKEFDQHFKNQGLNLSVGDKKFNDKLIDIAENVANEYQENLYQILKDTEVENEYIAQLAATELTRESLYGNELAERKDVLEKKIDELNTLNSLSLDKYKRKAAIAYAKKQLQKIDAAEQNMYEAHRKHEISNQAYNLYQKDYNERRKSLIQFLNDNSTIEDEITEQIKKLYKGKDEENFNSEINKAFSIIDSVIGDNIETNVPKSVSELIDKLITVEDAISYNKFIKPKTNNDFIERVKTIEEQTDLLAIKKLNDAAKKVEDYIIKQENLDNAFRDIIDGNVTELKKELDILKLGYYSTEHYYNSIKATVEEERQKRAKIEQESKKVFKDGKQVSEKEARETSKSIEKVVQVAENNSKKEETKQSNPSTGSKTEAVTKNSDEETVKIFKESIEEINNNQEKAEEKIVEQLKPGVDEEFSTVASSIAFNLFRNSRNLYDNIIGKDINSPEVQNILSIIKEELKNKNIPEGKIEEIAKRGFKMTLDSIASVLKFKKDSKADEFKRLANSIAIKQVLQTDAFAVTKTIANVSELNEVIDNFLKIYSEYKQIATAKNQKVIINLERLFDDIINDKNIDIDINTAMHILYNMKDYINNPLNTKYEFTAKRSFNSIIKNPVEFFNSIINSRSELEQLDNYMHISPTSSRDSNFEETIASLNGGEELEAYYSYDKKGNPVSIGFEYNGKEIGFISLVSPTPTNDGYMRVASKYSGGISYNITQDSQGNYHSNTDDLFKSIFDKTDILWDIINKQHLHNLNGSNPGLTNNEIDDFLKHSKITDAIKKGDIILPMVWDNVSKSYVPKFVTDRQKVQYIINKLEGVIFYDITAQTMIEYKDSYYSWIKNIYNNCKNTHKLQTELAKNKKVKIKYAGTSNVGNNGTTDIKSIITEDERGISDIGLTYDRNPIVGVVNVDGNATLINETTGVTTSSSAPFQIGSMGMFIGGRDNTPILAMFTSANKLSKGLKKQLYTELTDIFIGYQKGEYSFEDVDKKLSCLFNGPGIKNPTIFQGYSVIRGNNNLALTLNGESKKYVLVINKFKKNSSELNTAINYASNGEIDKATRSVKANEKFIETLVNEITDNIVYNKTFYTLNNVKKDNTDDNPYMYKENGKFVINIGGVKTAYENFGDFVLKENAFNTNQGINRFGGYFDNTDKANSLYIDVSVIKASDKDSSPVEGTYQSVADTIKTATEDKPNSTKELLEKSTISKQEAEFLTGKNDYKLSLVPEKYEYDPHMTHTRAKYSNGRMIFSKVGANEANESPITLKRLLIHEHLHHKIKELDLFKRENLVYDLLDTYNATVEIVEKILKTEDKTSSRYKNAKLVKEWLDKNKFNPVDYFTNFNRETNDDYAKLTQEQRNRIFAEEWLVETLTQNLLINFLNSVEYRNQEILVDGIKKEDKTIWQRIIDLLLQLFGKDYKNVKNNTIFAKQYILFSNISNIENANQQTEQIEDEANNGDKVIDENKVTNENIKIKEENEEVTTNENEEVTTNVDDLFNEDNNSDSDSDSDIDLGNQEQLAATTTTEDYIEEYTDEMKEILENAPRNDEGKLLAPNRKISNLNEWQYAVVRTKTFKEWFGDWTKITFDDKGKVLHIPDDVSKVVDDNGEPLVVYHESPDVFNIFDISKKRYNVHEVTGIWASAINRKGKGYGENIYPLFFNLRNPINTSIKQVENITELRTLENNALKDVNSDGAILDTIDKFGRETQYYAKKPNQVKNATRNTEFSNENNDIYHANTTTADEYILEHISNDGGATAETFGVTRITNMNDYLNMFAEQDKPLIAKMLENGEIKYACR